MKKIYSALLLVAAMSFAACSAKVSEDPDQKRLTDEAAKWPAYSDEALAGKVFGKDWSAKTAVARLNAFDSNYLVVSLYAEPVANACSLSAVTSKPYAVISIPASYSVTEYRADLYNSAIGYKNVVDFKDVSSLGSSSYSADRSRVSIASTDSTGFQAYIWATTSVSKSAANLSDINGQIHVLDCRKAVAFSEWTALKGNYKLESFNGIAQDLRFVSIQDDPQSRFYDNASASYINALPFPLFFSVSANSDAQYDFGPMDGLGVSKISTTATTKTLQYSFNGPINYNNKDITLILDMTVVKQDQYLDVSYTLEIPGFVTKTTHKFKLVKSAF